MEEKRVYEFKAFYPDEPDVDNVCAAATIKIEIEDNINCTEEERLDNEERLLDALISLYADEHVHVTTPKALKELDEHIEHQMKEHEAETQGDPQ